MERVDLPRVPPNDAGEASPHGRTEHRIARLTLLLGFVAAALTAVLHDWRWGAGLAIGAALGWLNFRWLKQGLDALVRASTAQAGSEQPRVPVGAYLRMLLRYGLIALSVYVIFMILHLPVLSMIVGLCALGAATVAASVYEIFRPME